MDNENAVAVENNDAPEVVTSRYLKEHCSFGGSEVSIDNTFEDKKGHVRYRCECGRDVAVSRGEKKILRKHFLP